MEELGAAVYELSDSTTIVRTARGDLLRVEPPSATVLDSLAGRGDAGWAEAGDLRARLARSLVRRPSPDGCRLFGEGRLAAALAAELGCTSGPITDARPVLDRPIGRRRAPEDIPVPPMIFAWDTPDEEAVTEQVEWARAFGVVFLTAVLEHESVSVGPLCVGGATSDAFDLLRRRLMSARHPALYRVLTGAPLGGSSPLEAADLRWAALLVRHEIQHWLATGSCRLLFRELLARPLERAYQWHVVLPLPERVEDSKSARRWVEMAGLTTGLELLVDRRTGPVVHAEPIPHHPSVPSGLVTYQAFAGQTARVYPWTNSRVCGGSSFRGDGEARRASIGEAVERYSGNMIDLARLRHATHRDLVAEGRRALDPEQLVLYSDAQYQAPGFPFERFTADTAVRWVDGFQSGPDGTVWLPASMTYVNWLAGPLRGEPAHHSHHYAGIAAGPSLEAAILGGIEEVVERDITMVWWSNAHPLATVDVSGTDLAALTAESKARGQDLRFITLPNEFGIPVVVAVLWQEDEGLLNLGFGCRPDPVAAAFKAATEAFTLQEGSRDLDNPNGLYRRGSIEAVVSDRILKPWRADRHYLDDYHPQFRDVTALLCQQQLFLDPRAQEAVRPWLDTPRAGAHSRRSVTARAQRRLLRESARPRRVGGLRRRPDHTGRGARRSQRRACSHSWPGGKLSGGLSAARSRANPVGGRPPGVAGPPTGGERAQLLAAAPRVSPMRPARHTWDEPRRKASGRWRFLTDHLETPPPGALFVHIVRSPQASGRLLSWAGEAAHALEGVHSVWAPSDVPAIVFNSAAAPPAPPLVSTADQRLLTDEPRHVGDACLAVVTADEVTGRRAEDALACCWEAAPPALPVRLSDAPRLGAISSTTVPAPADTAGCADHHLLDVVIETESAAVEHLCLEGPACLVEPDDDGALTVHTNSQAPSDVRRAVSEIVGLPLHCVRVLKYQEGGGFGAKQEVYDEPLLSFLASRLSRPLWARRALRTTLAAGRTRHETRLTCRARIEPSGALAALDLRGDVNSGAYASHVAYVMANIAEAGSHLYPDAAHHFELTARFTNQIPGGAFRGYGAVQALLAVEQALDEGARQTGLSPFEIRRRNAGRHPRLGSASRRPGTSRLRDVLDLAEEAWAQRPIDAAPPGWLTGWGLAAAAMLSTTVVPVPEGTAAVLRLNEDGTFTLATGSCDCGTGSSHALAGLAGEALGVDARRVGVVEGDSDLVLMDLGSFAQRTIYVAGASVVDAARALRRRILAAAAARLGCPASDLTVTPAGILDAAGRPRIDLAELARRETVDGRTLLTLGGVGPATNALPLSYVVVVVAVAVHPGEGTVTVPAALIAADCGTVLDPVRVRGQLEGGFVQGLSATLCERWAPDQRGRGPLTLLEHRALGPGALPELQVVLLDVPEPTGPRGAKGIGELGIPAVAPAVANAVRDAVGHRIRGIPITRADVTTRGATQ